MRNEIGPPSSCSIPNSLGRLRLLERERAERVAFEQFMRSVPLPTVLLRWNLSLVYRNQAAAEFCAMWERGFSRARFIKLKAALPPEILDRCRVLKKRWKQVSPLGLAPSNFRDETVQHPTRRDLRATISLKQISSAAVARPHFLVEFESLRGGAVEGSRTTVLPCRIWRDLRSENRTWRVLVCEGRSNQEIADESGVSLETVKKHLHSIFCKLEVPSRSRLMALIR